MSRQEDDTDYGLAETGRDRVGFQRTYSLGVVGNKC